MRLLLIHLLILVGFNSKSQQPGYLYQFMSPAELQAENVEWIRYKEVIYSTDTTEHYTNGPYWEEDTITGLYSITFNNNQQEKVNYNGFIIFYQFWCSGSKEVEAMYPERIGYRAKRHYVYDSLSLLVGSYYEWMNEEPPNQFGDTIPLFNFDFWKFNFDSTQNVLCMNSSNELSCSLLDSLKTDTLYTYVKSFPEGKPLLIIDYEFETKTEYIYQNSLLSKISIYKKGILYREYYYEYTSY